MSRIEEALKRAEAQSGDDATTATARSAARPPHDVPSPDVFRDPWTLDKAANETVAAPSAAAPAAVRSTPVLAVSASAPALTDADGDPLGSPVSALAPFHGMDPNLAEKIVATPTIRPVFAEQYRRLAGTLHHAQVERGIKVVMVTSALAGEGKSLTCTNLALTFSESYQRSVLLVDADLRRPTLHDTFRVPNVSGLGDGLRAATDQKLSLVQISPRLTLLTAGRPDPDPMSGLTSDRMRQVIEEASARYDWVIIDTPPVGLLPDANLLAAMVDSALLVIEAGKTPYPLIQRAIAAIGRARILGVVLNRAEQGIAGGHGYYDYYERYGKTAGQAR